MKTSEKKKYEEMAAEAEARNNIAKGNYERTIGQMRLELQNEYDTVARQQKDIEVLCKVWCILNTVLNK